MNKVRFIPEKGFVIFDRNDKEIDISAHRVLVDDRWDENINEHLSGNPKLENYSSEDEWIQALNAHHEENYKNKVFSVVDVTIKMRCLFLTDKPE